MTLSFKIHSMIKAIVTTTVMLAASATTTPQSVGNVRYTVDRLDKTINVLAVDDVSSVFKIVAPGGRAVADEHYDTMHHFPGVITDVMLTGAASELTPLQVLLENGQLLNVTTSRVYVNFHTHKQRLVYAQLRAFVLDDFELANKVYIGAPILSSTNKLVSVVSCRYDDYRDGVVAFPVSGVRSPGLISGQLHFDDTVLVHALDPAMSVYGRMQLPYATESQHELSVKRLAISAYNNRQMYRDWPRSVIVFHNKRDVIINLVEGEFEIDRVRLDGPMVRAQSYHN
ncbi:p26 [Orgyia pseudotsugata single capsid nuclopolyhedrovirus]|nr:p26 [Orgyia pseudotsugata single capsid nuclopolyhedrovirus]